MNDLVTLELRGSTSAFAEDLDEDVRALDAAEVPLAWLSLLTEADLERPEFWAGCSASLPVSWAGQVRAAYTTPDQDRIPPLEVSWPVARARLRSAVTGLRSRGDPWAGPVAEWEDRLDALAAQGPTLRVVLDLEPASAYFEDADAFVRALLQGIHWWSDPESTPRPEVESETELTGGPVEEVSVPLTGRTRSAAAPPRTAGERVVDAALVGLLSTGTLMTFALTGSVWWAGTVFLLVVAGISWSIFRKKTPAGGQPFTVPLTLHPVSHAVTVRPSLLSVFVCTLLLLSGLLDLWGQLHRVQGPCCSRTYYNYWPARTWMEVWVTSAFIMLVVVSQTVRLRGDQVTVTWLLGMLRLSRPVTQVTAEPVELTVPRTQERVAGLRLRVGWVTITITENQAGYPALRNACIERKIGSP